MGNPLIAHSSRMRLPWVCSAGWWIAYESLMGWTRVFDGSPAGTYRCLMGHHGSPMG